MRLSLVLFFVMVNITLFQSCGPIDLGEAPHYPDFSTDPIFTPYIQEFEYYSGTDSFRVPIGFGDLKPGTAGTCHTSTVGGVVVSAYIKIDSEFWKRATHLQKINLIFHELGHCLLRREHVRGFLPNGCPNSFMYDSVMSDSCLNRNFNLYISEMFH